MTRQDDKKGSFSTDIPAQAVEEALRSVEKPGAQPGPDSEPAPALEPPTVESLSAEVESLKAQLDLSQEKARETLDKLKEEHERFLRAAADLDNFRKRARREQEDLQKFANEKLLKDVLPVVDSIDRALELAPAESPFTTGVSLVRKTLEDALARHGVEAFSALGEPFDPQRHEAIFQIPSTDRPPGTVLAEHGRGFFLHGRLVRPAMVGVAVAPAPQPAAGEEPG